MFENKKYFARGKHSTVYTSSFKGRKVAVKVERIPGRAKKEASYLKLLNRHGIGPTLVLQKNKCLVYEFVHGTPIMEWIRKSKKRSILLCFQKLLQKCRVLDRLRINKKEFHNPHKHILVKGSAPKMIDFERCHRTDKPKNVTQLLQFLTSKKMSLILNEKGILLDKKYLKNVLVKYKRSYSERDFGLIENYLRNT